MRIIYLLFFGLASAKPLNFSEDVSCGYDSCPATDPNKINVHIVPHSHDDVGWLKTIDQYYFQDVIDILSSVVTALKQNPERRFIQVETAFFKKWWDEQNEQTKKDVRELVNEGRLEIVNGAWSMNDEAAVHYQSTVDQFTLGLRYIEDSLGKCGRPRIGWQIDPFGHSREQASIYSQIGFDAFYVCRLDYRDKQRRHDDKAMDLLWRGSDNLGSDSHILTTVLYNEYSAPPGFCFDHVCNDAPIVEDEDSIEYNFETRVNEFANYVKEQAQYYPTNNVIITMGDDFRYKAAHTTYMNLDRLIRGFKKFNPIIDGKEINIFYSTPSCYVKAVNEYVINNNITLEVKTDDFFPYALYSTNYFGGYFTSRPTSKRFERIANNLLQVTRQLTAAAGFKFGLNYLLENAVGVMQHHDAITGTEKQEVEKDYHRLITAGMKKAIQDDNRAISTLLGDGTDLGLSSCLLLNVSLCPETKKDQFNVLLYNPLARSVSHYIQIPVDSETWAVTGPVGNETPYQIVNPVSNFDYISKDVSTKVLIFKADLPPIGFNVYNFNNNGLSAKRDVAKPTAYQTKIGFENTFVELDDATGLLKSITINEITLEVKQEYLYYQGTPEGNAYVFRPDPNFPALNFTNKVTNTITDGSLVKEVKQVFNDWVSHTIRIFEDEDFVEIDYVIGPIDVGDNIGKEIISRFSTNLDTNGIFYTDSNGRELLERKRNYRPTYQYTDEVPEGGNLYPINTRIAIKDTQNEFAIITDRSHGGGSLKDGELELLLHRASLYDDVTTEHLYEIEYNKGVVSRGSLYITLGNIEKGNGKKSIRALEKDIVLRKHLSPWIFFTEKEIPTSTLSLLRTELPENVHLLTFDKWNDEENTYLIRLEHILELNDDSNLSNEVTVDLANLFSRFTVVSLKETTLAGVTPLEESVRLSWPQIKEDYKESCPLNKTTRILRDPEDLKISLAPMQIRTFVATVE